MEVIEDVLGLAGTSVILICRFHEWLAGEQRVALAIAIPAFISEIDSLFGTVNKQTTERGERNCGGVGDWGCVVAKFLVGGCTDSEKGGL